MFFLKNPFNKVVRSSEALVIGLLVGLLLGVIGMIYVPIQIESKMYMNPSKICVTGVTKPNPFPVESVDYVVYSYTGQIVTVKCKDGRKFEDF